MILEYDTRVGNASIHWAETGSGEPPYVLLHGLGWSWTVWQEVMPLLAAERRVIALDMPGHGQSDAPDGSYSPAWLAGGVRAFLDAAGIPRAVLVGNSLGGLVAATLAAAEPERVAALALVAPALPNDGPPADKKAAAEYAAKLLPVIGPIIDERFWGRDPDLVVDERLQRNFAEPARASAEMRAALRTETVRRARSKERLRIGLRATRQVVWAMTGRREASWATLRSLRMPTAFIWGDTDRQVPPQIGKRAVSEVPGSHLITLEDCGHTPQAEHPRAFAGAVSAFVRAAEAKVNA